jgi:uncharacterized protein YecE (DUF72 family)
MMAGAVRSTLLTWRKPNGFAGTLASFRPPINGSFYLRGHGPDGRCKDHYSDRILRAWARYTGKWRRERRSVFVYFDNDQKSAAPTDARRLAEILQQAGR